MRTHDEPGWILVSNPRRDVYTAATVRWSQGMSSFLVLSLTGLASVAVVLSAAGFVLFRAQSRALGFWLLGWSSLLGAAFITLLASHYDAILAIGPIFTTFVAPCMLLGACAHAQRPEPLWILPAAFMVGVLRVSTYLLGVPDLSTSISMATEPVLAVVAAWTILHPGAERTDRLSTTDRLLALGFVLYGCTEFFDAYSRSRGEFGWANWIAWLAVALPLATLQIVLHLDRLGRRSRDSEDDARANAMRLRMLEESSHDFLAEFSDRGILTYVSPSGIEKGEHPAVDYLGRNILEFLHPDTCSPLSRAILEQGRATPADVAATSGTSHRVIQHDGSDQWVDFLGSTYRTVSGELRIVARIRDVTSNVLKQDVLRQSEASLRRAERIAGLGSWELDGRTGALSFSDELLRIHGLPAREGPVDSDALRALVHPDDLEALSENLEHARITGTPIEHVYRIMRADDGLPRTFRTLGEVDRDAEGNVTRLVGATIDITEQVELMNNLRQGQERFQSLVDSNIVCVYFADRDGHISEANAAFLSLLGYEKEDLPLDWRELTAVEFREAENERIAASRDPSSVPQPFESELIARDGRRVSMLLSFAMLTPDSAILIGVDLSERKRAEVERARHQLDLEATVAARTQELVESQTRLIEAERLAVVGTLAAGVAHQINNPIGAILNCAEYALLCRDDDDSRATYERALRDNLAEARRCAQIVRSMLQFARDQPTAKWIEDLNRVVRRAQRAISAYAKDRSATIAFSTEDERLLARISPIELEQAIVNILRNAIESRERGVHVSLRLARRDKNAIIEVTDDGRGVDPLHQERVFEPFFSTRTREGGTGLGLSVSHGIVVDHGGQIRIDSVPGMGTRVVISLPIEESSGRRESGLPTDD